GRPRTKAELLDEERSAMLPLPTEAFEARRVVHARANSLSLVRFDRNDYSVPTAFAHHEVTVLGGVEEVRIACGDRLVARHPRCWDKEQVTFDPVHYLALLERKPGALDVARPLESWEVPGCFALLRRRLESSLGHRGTREFITVLRLLERASVSELAAGCAADNHDHLTYPLEVTELELLERERKAAERRLKAARFPVLKSLHTFDFAARPSVNRAMISSLARCEFIDARENVLFVGN